MSISETCFRLVPWKLCHIEGRVMCLLNSLHLNLNAMSSMKVAPYLLLKNKQITAAWPKLLVSLHVFMLRDLASNMWLRYDEVCTFPIWNKFQKWTAHHANLKHVSGCSGWHMFQNSAQHTYPLYTYYPTVNTHRITRTYQHHSPPPPIQSYLLHHHF